MGNAQNKPKDSKKSKKDKNDRKSKQSVSEDNVTKVETKEEVVTKEEKPTPKVKETVSADTTINFTYEDTTAKNKDPNEYLVGAYKVLRTLGKGSFGEVYLVILKEEEKNPNPTLYALKKMFSPDTQSAQAPIQEAEILKTLKHINVVQYNDLFVHFEDGSAFMCLVMEFIDGGTLTEFATQSWDDSDKWNTEVVIRWLFKLLEGIDYVHSMKVVHRDLKPDNLFITFDKSSNELQLKIADFGVSTSNVAKKGQPDISGTPVFMAPEQITYGMFDIKVDMWAIGVILYQVALKLTAIPFIMAQETMDNRKRHINTIEDPSIRYLATILLKHKSDHRPTAPSLLKHPLLLAWKSLLFNKTTETSQDSAAVLAYISGLTSASDIVSDKSYKCLRELTKSHIVKSIKDYRCSGPLLKYLTSNNAQERKDFVLSLLLEYSESDVMNKSALRDENAVNVLWNVYKSSANAQILRLIASMYSRNQKLFEKLGVLPLIREFVTKNEDPKLSAEVVSAFSNMNDQQTIEKVKEIIAKSPELTLLFCTMRDSKSVLQSGLFPSLLSSIKSHKEAITVLKYLLTDVTSSMIGTYEQGYCSGAITKCNEYEQESFQCTTCWPNSMSSICLFCAKSCHKGHILILKRDRIVVIVILVVVLLEKREVSGVEFGGLIFVGISPEFLTFVSEANHYDNVTFPRKDDSTVKEISPLVFQPINDITYSIQSDQPLTADGIGNLNSTVAYFEMTILESNKGPSEVFLGLAPEFYPTASFPGEVVNTVGYYGYTGKRYCGETDGDFYGPKYSEGDTVGVAITNQGDVYFTKNGKYLGVATTIKKNTNYFITIGFRSKQVKVACNYGKTPFTFQFVKKSYETKTVIEVQNQVDSEALEAIFKRCTDSNSRNAIGALSTMLDAVRSHSENIDQLKELTQEEDPTSKLQSQLDKLIDEETSKSKGEIEQVKKESQKAKGFQDLDIEIKVIPKAKEVEPPKPVVVESPKPVVVESPKPVEKKEDDDLNFLLNPVKIPAPVLTPPSLIPKKEAAALPPVVAKPTQDEEKLAEQLSEIDKLLKFE